MLILREKNTFSMLSLPEMLASKLNDGLRSLERELRFGVSHFMRNAKILAEFPKVTLLP